MVAGPKCSEQVEKVMREILESFTASFLPRVIRDITPVIRESLEDELIPMLRREIIEATKGAMGEVRDEITNDFNWRQFSQFDVERFWEKHAEALNKCEGLRDNALRKVKRLENMLNLYHEQLNTSPIYVPRKFRKDKYHIKSSSELEVLKNREVNDMKSEMEIMRLRLVENEQRVQHQDDLFLIFLNENVQNSYIKDEVVKTWNKNNKKESDRLDNIWARKIRETKIAFEKDKEYIRNHNSKRFKQTNNPIMGQGVIQPTRNRPLPQQQHNPHRYNHEGQQQDQQHLEQQQRQQPLQQEEHYQQQTSQQQSDRRLVMVLDGLQDPTVVNVLEELNTLSPRNAAENDTLEQQHSEPENDSLEPQNQGNVSSNNVSRIETPAGIVLEESHREVSVHSPLEEHSNDNNDNDNNQQIFQPNLPTNEDPSVFPYEMMSDVEDGEFEDHSQILFPDTLDKNMVELLVAMEYSEDEESDDELASGNHFRRSYDLRNRPQLESKEKVHQSRQKQPKRKKSQNQLTKSQHEPKSSIFQRRHLRSTR